jgi:hypothetical protein
MAEAAADTFRVIIPSARRVEVERYRIHGMLRGALVLEDTNGVTFAVRCTDERDALWLRLCYA